MISVADSIVPPDETASPREAAPLIDPSMLFRFEIALQRDPLTWTKRGLALPDSCKLPSFGALSGRSVYADVRMAWNPGGIGLQLSVNGKRQLPWCRETRLDESDGFHFWIDTRCSPGIHRASQYCHRFLWMPSGGGPNRETPVVALVPIHRARSNPKKIPSGQLKLVAFPRHDGYELSGYVPAGAMTGFDPDQQAKVGFYYAVVDRELGWQTLTLGPEYPVCEDPSLWGEAVLEG